MDKDELKAKYARIANDPSQLEMFKNDVIDGTTTCLPDTSELTEAAVLVYEDGEIKWSTTQPGPTPPVPPTPTPTQVVKGDIIKIAGDWCRVLSANEDMTDCEVMHIGPIAIGRYYESGDIETVNFTENGATRVGIKYEGSLLDSTCEDFYDSLPQEVQDAIIAQDIVQDMYVFDIQEDVEGAYYIDNQNGSQIYRFKKINDTSINVGTRHAYALSLKSIVDYFGGKSVINVEYAKIFQFNIIFRDAYVASYDAMCYIGSYDSSVSATIVNYDRLCFICPAFHIDLTKITL